MHLCRFDQNRLGVVEGDTVYDVTSVVAGIPTQRWPIAFGDPLVAHLAELREPITAAKRSAVRLALGASAFNSPIAWPTKILAAPANYRLHVQLDTLDPGVDQGHHRASLIDLDRPVDAYGLFLKASSSLVGPAEGITLAWPGRRCDHEVELAVVIGKTAKNVSRTDALAYVAGYAIGLDITVRGTEERSFRKSADSFAVLGPWLTTADEIPDPQDLTIWLEVNGEPRQRSSTGAMTVGIAELIEIASRVYTLHPGDILMTGTPEGVGALADGDLIRAGCERIGEMSVKVRSTSRNVTVARTLRQRYLFLASVNQRLAPGQAIDVRTILLTLDSEPIGTVIE